MIREIDHDIYNRYKDGHDGTMDKYLQWYEQGGRRSSIGARDRTKEDQIFQRTTELINKLREDYAGSKIAKMLGIGQNLVYQLSYGNHNCSKEKAIQITNKIENEFTQ